MHPSINAMLYNPLTSTIATDTGGSGEHYIIIFEYQLTVLCTPSVPQRGLRAMNDEGISYVQCCQVDW